MPKRARSVKEKIIEAELVRRVEAINGICLKITTLGRRGLFDRVILLPGGRVIWAEIKKPRSSRISPHQRQYIEEFRALGLVVAVVKTVADIDALLRPQE